MTDRLFGLDGGESLDTCLDSAIETYLDCYLADETEHVIEVIEWSVAPAEDHMPSPESVIEHVIEWACDNGEVDEHYCQMADAARSRRDVVAAFWFALNLLAHHVPYRMADREVARHQVRIWFERGDTYPDACWEVLP